MFILVPFAIIIDSPCPWAWIGKENAELKETYKLIVGHSAVRAAAYPQGNRISNLSEDFGEECVFPSGPLDLDAQGAL